MASFWTQRGDGSPKELQGIAKTWRTKYGVVQRSKRFWNAIDPIMKIFVSESMPCVCCSEHARVIGINCNQFIQRV